MHAPSVRCSRPGVADRPQRRQRRDIQPPGCERLRCQGADHERAALSPGLRVSLSFSCTPARPGDCVATLARRADAALYAAKGAGRNRVEAAWALVGNPCTPARAARGLPSGDGRPEAATNPRLPGRGQLSPERAAAFRGWVGGWG